MTVSTWTIWVQTPGFKRRWHWMVNALAQRPNKLSCFRILWIRVKGTTSNGYGDEDVVECCGDGLDVPIVSRFIVWDDTVSIQWNGTTTSNQWRLIGKCGNQHDNASNSGSKNMKTTQHVLYTVISSGGSRNFEGGSGRQCNRHLSQVLTANYMPFIREKAAYLQKFWASSRVATRYAPFESATGDRKRSKKKVTTSLNNHDDDYLRKK